MPQSVLPIADFFSPLDTRTRYRFFNDVIILSVDQIKVTSIILIGNLDYVFGGIAHKKPAFHIVQVKLKL